MVTYKFLCTLALFFSAVSAMPLTRLAARATKCGDGGISPCACNGALGLRKSTLACPADSFRFKNPFDQKDGTIVPTAGNAGSGLQCDQYVYFEIILVYRSDSNEAWLSCNSLRRRSMPPCALTSNLPLEQPISRPSLPLLITSPTSNLSKAR